MEAPCTCKFYLGLWMFHKKSIWLLCQKLSMEKRRISLRFYPVTAGGNISKELSAYFFLTLCRSSLDLYLYTLPVNIYLFLFVDHSNGSTYWFFGTVLLGTNHQCLLLLFIFTYFIMGSVNCTAPVAIIAWWKNFVYWFDWIENYNGNRICSWII